MKKIILFATAVALMQPASAALLGRFNFNTLTSVGAAPNNYNQTVYAADAGVGTLNLVGWTSGPGTVSSIAGVGNSTGLNANLVSPDVTGRSLQLFGGIGTSTSPTVNNGASIVLALPMLGKQNPIISYAAQRTSSGFQSFAVAYSTDNMNFTNFSTVNINTTLTVSTLDFSSVNALDNQATIYIRLTTAGATAASGNMRLDNIQFNAVPEPASLLALGAGALLIARRRKA
jgi:hypothetical protein